MRNRAENIDSKVVESHPSFWSIA